MTPTRDEDANSENFSSVIPLRRRTQGANVTALPGALERPAAGIWGPDAPVVDLPERSLWDTSDATTELPLRKRQPARPVGTTEATVTRPTGPSSRVSWRASRPRALALAAAFAAVAACAALFVSGLSGASRPHAAPLPTAAATSSTPPAAAPQEHAPAARASASRGHDATAAVRTAPTRTTARRHVALTTSRHTPTQRPSTTFTAVVSHAKSAPATVGAARSDNVDGCVPGELGC
jgi:hypothetical protein